MGIRNWFKKNPAATPATPPVPEDVDASPESYLRVLAYIESRRNGAPLDEAFEQLSFPNGLRFDSLDLAELIYALAQLRDIPLERISHFLRVGLPGGGDTKLALLIERIHERVLDTDYDPERRDMWLRIFPVKFEGAAEYIGPIREPFNTVGQIVNFCRAIESLKNLKDHDAIDAESGQVKEDPTPPVPEDVDETTFSDSHLRVLAYIESRRNGAPLDEAFERLSFPNDLRFDSLNLAELIYALAQLRDIPLQRITHWLRIGLPGAGDTKLALLIQRIDILARGAFPEFEREKLLRTGIVGDRNEICPINEPLNDVGFIVKFCGTIESLKDLRDHHAIDAESGQVKEDLGWQ